MGILALVTGKRKDEVTKWVQLDVNGVVIRVSAKMSKNNQAKLLIDAPKEVNIVREEILRNKTEESATE